MLFAQGWWHFPDLTDRELSELGVWLAVVGLVLAVGSVWFAWWLAARDLRGRIESAKRQALRAVDRLSLALLAFDLADAIHLLEVTDDAVATKRWPRARDATRSAIHRLARLMTHPLLIGGPRATLAVCIDDVRQLAGVVGQQPKSGQGTLSAAQAGLLSDVTARLSEIEGRLRNGLWEVRDEP